MIEKKKLQKMTIGQRIKNIRKLKRYSQEEIGRKINIRQRLVSDYEIGRLRISVEMLIKFANALEVDINELIKNEDSKKNTKPISSKLTQRMRKIETLPPAHKKMIVKTIDALLMAAEK